MSFLAFLFNIDGRVRRREFFLFSLVMMALFANWVGGMRHMARQAHVYANTATNGYLMHLVTYSGTHYAYLALLVLVSYTVVAKRLHDRGRSGWWQLAGLVPVIGWAWLLLELYILPGSPGDNRYGPHPTFSPDPDKAPIHLKL